MSANKYARIVGLIVIAFGALLWVTEKMATGSIYIKIPTSVDIWLEANLLSAAVILIVAFGLVTFVVSFIPPPRKS